MDTTFISSFAGSNGIPVLLFAIVTIITIAILAKKGIISFNGKGLKIGQDIDTRNLIQNQFEYANAKCEGVISRLPTHLDLYHTKYIIARVEDVIQKAIVFNNLTDNEDYIKAKQELVYQTVMKRVTDKYFKTEEFRAFVYKFVEELFRDLYRMKRVH